MAKRRPRTSPAPLYRIEKRLVPKAKAAFAGAVKAWQQDVDAGKPPNPQALTPLVAVTQDGTRLAGIAAAGQIGALKPGLSLAFDLTNPRAVAWAEANAGRLIRDILPETQQAIREAIVASMKGDLTVQEVARFVREQVGLTVKQREAAQAFFERALESGYAKADALDEMYVYTDKLIKYRSEVIARTEVLRAEGAGQELLWEQGVESGQIRGMVKVWSATGDELQCPICAAMNGKTAQIGEPWIGPEGEVFEQPQDSHPQCLPGSMRVMANGLADVFGAVERGYDGEVVILRVAARQELRVTPNHPILTPGGWVAAGALREGDEVVCHRLAQWEGLTEDNDVDVPPTIQDVVRAFVESRAVVAKPVPTTAEDFDGDGIEGKIAIVWTDRHLRPGRHAERGQQREQLPLTDADVRLIEAASFVGERHEALRLHGFGTAETRRMSSADLMGAGISRHAAPFQPLCVGLATCDDAYGAKSLDDHGSGNAEGLREREDGRARLIAFDQSGDRGPGVMPRSVVLGRNPEAFQMGIQEGDRHASLTHQWGHALAGHITINQLLYVGRAQFTGHVYNLETAQGWYVAESIVAHNCRCSSYLSEEAE